jgi:hypothetical protein
MNDLLIYELARARLADLRQEADHHRRVARIRRAAAAVGSTLAGAIPRQRGPVQARAGRRTGR